MKLYGIKNCDSVKKARRFLEQAQLPYQFHDYRQNGLTMALLADFAAQLGWQALLNTRGTTWRSLSDEQKTITNESDALLLMLAQPSLIKRPLLVSGTTYLLGYNEHDYQKLTESSKA